MISIMMNDGDNGSPLSEEELVALANILYEEGHAEHEFAAELYAEGISEMVTTTTTADDGAVTQRAFTEALESYLGLSEQAAQSIVEQLSRCVQETEAEAESQASSEEENGEEAASSGEEEERLVGPGDCELCERSNVKLTRHHLLPKSTWPRIETRLYHLLQKHADQGVVREDDEGLAHLLPLLQGVVVNAKSKKTKACGMIRNVLRRQTCDICRQCHTDTAVHKYHDNMTLAVHYNTVTRLIADERTGSFCQWASKQRPGMYATI
jgi:hypothetical protein